MNDPHKSTETPDAHLFRRGITWLRKTGIGHTGKKAKRLIHRRDRHQSRTELRTLSPN